MSEGRDAKPQQQPFSLYGQSPEDALRRALSTPPPPKPAKMVKNSDGKKKG